jgi:hypothetical protein
MNKTEQKCQSSGVQVRNVNIGGHHCWSRVTFAQIVQDNFRVFTKYRIACDNFSMVDTTALLGQNFSPEHLKSEHGNVVIGDFLGAELSFSTFPQLLD